MAEFSLMLAWGILLVGAVLLAVLWPWLPDTWAIHYGASGQPDGWTHKTFLGAYFPLMLGAFIVGISQLLKLASPSGEWATTPEAREKLSALNRRIVDSLSTAIALIMVMWSLVLPLLPGMLLMPVVLTFAAIGVATMVMIRDLQRTIREIGAPKGYSGIAYNNPDDPRLWVPKITGMGTTLNFAHPWAWPVFLAILAGPIGLVALIFLSAR